MTDIQKLYQQMYLSYKFVLRTKRFWITRLSFIKMKWIKDEQKTQVKVGKFIQRVQLRQFSLEQVLNTILLWDGKTSTRHNTV